MDDRNLTDWDSKCPHKEDSTKNPYYNQPTHSPYRGQGFAIASMICGILSMVLNCIAVVPFVLAGLGIIFASLDYRRGKRRSHFAFYGLISSVFGILTAAVMLLQAFSLMWDGALPSAYQQYLQQYLEQLQ